MSVISTASNKMTDTEKLNALLEKLSNLNRLAILPYDTEDYGLGMMPCPWGDYVYWDTIEDIIKEFSE